MACPTGTFLRGVLDKVGVEPQVQRIGAYKSAGDQLLRTDMSEAQREQLGELLDDIYEEFLTTVAEARGKTREVRCRSHLVTHRSRSARAAAVGSHTQHSWHSCLSAMWHAAGYAGCSDAYSSCVRLYADAFGVAAGCCCAA